MTPTERQKKVDRQRARRAEKKALGLCRDCSNGKIYAVDRCRPCLKKHRKNTNAAQNKRHARFRRLGLCRYCGRRKALPGTRSCALH